MSHDCDYGGVNAPRWFHASPVHVEALSRLEFVAESRQPIAWMSGPPGTGKTRLVELFVDRLRRSGGDAVLVDAAAANGVEFVARLSRVLQLPESRDGSALWDELGGRAAAELPLLVVVDHVDPALPGWRAAIDRVLRTVSLPDGTPSVSLVLVGGDRPPSDWSVLDAALRILVEPLDATGTANLVLEYVASRNAGVDFTAESCERIHAISGGVPGPSLRIAEFAVLACRAEGVNRVSADHVVQVAVELGYDLDVLEPAPT